MTVGPGLPLPLFLGLIAVMGGIAIYAKVADARRSAALASACRARGWTYAAEKRDVPDADPAFRLFREGHDKYARHTATGKIAGDGGAQAIPVEAFEYHFTTGSSKNRQTHVYEVGRIRMPADSPGLAIADETLGRRIADAVDGGDIDFESHEFSERFWVVAADRKFAYDAIDGRMMEFLMAMPGGWMWQWRGRQLLLYAAGPLRPDDVAPMAQALAGFRAHLPRVAGGPGAMAMAGHGLQAAGAPLRQVHRPSATIAGLALVAVLILGIFAAGGGLPLPQLAIFMGIALFSGISFLARARKGDVI
ncbi:MAG: hypothetical protein ABR562_09195 [Thermoplasmatota archaeon]